MLAGVPRLCGLTLYKNPYHLLIFSSDCAMIRSAVRARNGKGGVHVPETIITITILPNLEQKLGGKEQADQILTQWLLHRQAEKNKRSVEKNLTFFFFI